VIGCSGHGKKADATDCTLSSDILDSCFLRAVHCGPKQSDIQKGWGKHQRVRTAFQAMQVGAAHDASC
jgi:hypothetical protein